jgi:hypothetical protein
MTSLPDPRLRKVAPKAKPKHPFERKEPDESRRCADCNGALQDRWDRLKFRPLRKVWICPACVDIEAEDSLAIETERPDSGKD